MRINHNNNNSVNGDGSRIKNRKLIYDKFLMIGWAVWILWSRILPFSIDKPSRI